MGVVGRLDQYASMLAGEFDDYSMSENLLLRSNSFSTAGTWTPVSATCVFTQNVTGPDNISNSAWTIDDQSIAADGAGFEQNKSITPSTTTNYCLSIFAKQGTATILDFYAFFTGTSTRGSYLRYNFSTNTLTASAAEGPGIVPTIFGKIDYPNGWYRFYFVVNDANSGLNNNLKFRIYPASRDTGPTGTTLFYGAQLEIGTGPTDYTPTTTTAISRVLPSTTNTNITGFSTYFSSGFDENVGFTTFLPANVFAPYDLVYDEFSGTLFGAGQGRYMRQNTDKSVIVYNEIDEVTYFRPRLILDLDAADPLSYSGTGTTWTDLSRTEGVQNGNNGTLVNGPTYSTENGGAIVLDGSDDYISTPLVLPSPSTRPTTFDLVFKFNTSPTTKWLIGSSFFQQYGFGIVAASSSVIRVLYNAAGASFEPSISNNNLIISNIVVVFDGRTVSFYKNGVFVSSSTASFNANASSLGMDIGRTGQLGYSAPGVNFYSVKVYNGALDGVEIVQNFNAIRSRYGL